MMSPVEHIRRIKIRRNLLFTCQPQIPSTQQVSKMHHAANLNLHQQQPHNMRKAKTYQYDTPTNPQPPTIFPSVAGIRDFQI